MGTLLDWGNVESATKQVVDNLRLSDRQEAFSLLCISTLLRIDFDEARGALTDGVNDRGVDAIYLDERLGRRIIHLFQMKCHGSFARTNRNFPSAEIDKLLSFVRDCFEQVDGFLESCNASLQQKVIDIWDFVQNGTCQVEIHLCSNGQKLTTDQHSRFTNSLKKFKYIHLYEVDLDGISDALSRRDNSNREIQLRIVEEQVFERTDGNVRAVIGTVRADEFINSLTDPSKNTQLDPDLFEQNVRIYLGEQNDINKRIFDTAISSEAGLFWYYNNGITIVCERFSYQPGFKSAPLRLLNPQVVNGGQTSHALFQASKVSFDSLQRVRLLVRIIETQDKSLYAKVAEATNSQTPIRSRDLRSNDPVLLKLEAGLRTHGWHLDRKRDQHSMIAESMRIDALKLGQVWLGYVRGEPDKAKTASDRIFGEYFPLVFDPTEMSAERVVNVWKLYLALEESRRRQISQSRSVTRSQAEQPTEAAWIVEGIYHLAYVVKRLAEVNNIDIFDFSRAKPLIKQAEQRISEFVKDRPGVSFYRLFRSAATKHNLFKESSDDKQLKLDFDSTSRASSKSMRAKSP